MKAGKTAVERTRRLLDDMPGRRKAVLAVLGYLREAHTPEDVRDEVARIQAHDTSAYSANSYCSLLEEAGAIRRVTPEGAAWPAERRAPEVVEEGGACFFKPGPRLDFLWEATQAGMQVSQENDPAVLIKVLVEGDAAYREIYARVLRLCAAQGCPIAVLNDAIDLDPLAQEPPLKASHFVERLETAGGVVWDGLWKTTPAGIAWLEAHGTAMEGE